MHVVFCVYNILAVVVFIYASNTHYVQIFRKLDSSKSGYIKLSEMKRYLLAGFHPDVIAGDKSEEEVILEVTNLFAVRKNVGWHLSTSSQLIPWAVSQDTCCHTLNTSWVVYARLASHGLYVPALCMGYMGVLVQGMGCVY